MGREIVKFQMVPLIDVPLQIKKGPQPRLSPREKKIQRLNGRGLTTEQIAEIENVSPGRIKFIKEKITAKTRSSSKNSKELSAKEREVWELVKLGFTNKQIAEKMGVSKHTITKHIVLIHAKVGI